MSVLFALLVIGLIVVFWDLVWALVKFISVILLVGLSVVAGFAVIIAAFTVIVGAG